jgi:cyanophycinase
MPMKNILLFTVTVIFLISQIVPAQEKGHLVIIGGGKRPQYVMQKMTELAGGREAKIVIVPNATSERLKTAEYQKKEFNWLGAASVDYILCSRETADDDSNLAKLDGATGIFFSGGDQSVLTGDLLGTKLFEKIAGIYNKGGVIGGTSAGAAVMSRIMLTGNEKLNTDSTDAFISIQKNNIEVKEGFGFITNGIIDQHFIKRKRHNRLISLVLENPELPGIAIDEQTAIVVYPDDTFEVMGESQVLIYDASEARNIRTDDEGNLRADNIKMHLLLNGDKYNLKTREVIE